MGGVRAPTRRCTPRRVERRADVTVRGDRGAQEPCRSRSPGLRLRTPGNEALNDQSGCRRSRRLPHTCAGDSQRCHSQFMPLHRCRYCPAGSVLLVSNYSRGVTLRCEGTPDRHYLTEETPSGQEITFLLGSDDRCSFSKASRSWTGRRPRSAELEAPESGEQPWKGAILGPPDSGGWWPVRR